MKKDYKQMTKVEKVNFHRGQIDFGNRMQGGFAYSYSSPVVPYLSSWFGKEFGNEPDWMETLKSLAESYGIDKGIVPQLVQHDLKSVEWNRLVEKFDLTSNSSKILSLLTQTKDIIKELPSPDWNNNSQELTNRIDEVKMKILNGTYVYNSFFFSDFNGKSPHGELWEYFRGLSEELKEIFNHLSKLIEEENAVQQCI